VFFAKNAGFCGISKGPREGKKCGELAVRDKQGELFLKLN
jgi:hypothetical protein